LLAHRASIKLNLQYKFSPHTQLCLFAFEFIPKICRCEHIGYSDKSRFSANLILIKNLIMDFVLKSLVCLFCECLVGASGCTPCRSSLSVYLCHRRSKKKNFSHLRIRNKTTHKTEIRMFQNNHESWQNVQCI
jgi:hypothetical protein